MMRQHGGRVRAIVAMAMVLGLAIALTGCGDKGGSKKVPAQLTSSSTQPFKFVSHQGDRYIVGHGVELKVPSSWGDYEAEKLSTLGDTFEWSAGLPANTKPIPAGVQFSMGVPDKGTPYNALPAGAKEAAEVAPGYKYIDSGSVDVAGARHASYLRFDRDLTIGSSTHKVEQLSLFLDVAHGAGSTIRFIAEAGDWDNQLKSVYDSVTVAEGTAS